MNAVLICPSGRMAVAELSRFTPLAAAPLLGESLIEYWLTHLALGGANEVRILADDRPEQIAALIGNGVRWGLKIEVVSEPRELTPAQAQIRYAKDLTSGGVPGEAMTVDHFPGQPEQPLFAGYADLFSGMMKWLPNAKTVDRVGIREIRPGVWVGAHAVVSPEAQLTAPCWIGQHTYIGARAVIGPMAVVEDRAFVESDAEVVSSVVEADTYVGQFAVIRDSFALGSTLINWTTGVSVQVTDALLLSALRQTHTTAPTESFLGRLSEIYTRNKDDLQMFWKHLLMNKEG